MRRNRIIWALLWILSMVVISFWGGPVSYGLFATLSLVFAFSLIYLLIVYIFFHIYQRTDGKEFVVNETIPFYFSLVNDYYFPFSGVRVKFFSSFSTINGLNDETEYELMPKTGINKETTLVCRYKGEYEVGIKSVEIQDYFRLFKFSYKNKETKRIVVLPQLVYLERLGDFDVESAVRESDSGNTENDVLVRNYTEGDDVRFINWTQTARTGNLMVRTKTGTEQNGVSVIMDTCRYSKDNLIYIPLENKIVETALALSLYFSKQNLSVSEYHIISASATAPLAVKNTVDSNDSFDEFYLALCRAAFTESNTSLHLFGSLLDKNEIYKSSALIMVTASWSEGASEFMDRLSLTGMPVIICFISDDEKAVPDFSSFPRVKLIRISPEDDLKEVFG